jgi:hypothetical protein
MLAWFDVFDHPAAVILQADLNPIANRQDIFAFCFTLEATADTAGDDTLIGGNRIKTRLKPGNNSRDCGVFHFF